MYQVKLLQLQQKLGRNCSSNKGVPLTKTPEGLKPISSSYKVLPSGNVEVKASDGK